jgi:hypothetical protein
MTSPKSLGAYIIYTGNLLETADFTPIRPNNLEPQFNLALGPILTTATMPPRLNLFTANKAVSALRQSTTPALSSPVRLRALQSLPIQRRWNSSRDASKKVEPQPDEQTYPTVDQLPHVSEEAHEISRIMDKEKRCDGIPATPELDQGTPVEEVSTLSWLLGVTGSQNC